MALLLLIFSSFINLRYGFNFRRPAVYVHTVITDESNLEASLLGIDDS